MLALRLLPLILYLPVVAAEFSIETNVDCNARLALDRAMVQFLVDDDLTDVALYAVNAQCYNCLRSVVAEESNACASLFSPHEWNLRLVDTVTNSIIADTDYTFGEHGRYEVTASSNAGSAHLHVKEVHAPIDSLHPLVVLISLLIVFIICSFLFPYLYTYYKANHMEASSEARESLLGSRHSDKDLVSTPINRDALSLRDTSSPAAPNATTRDSLASPQRDTFSTRDSTPIRESIRESTPPVPAAPSRLHSLDTFRGLSLCLMIFVNYGGGGYWFLEHADWHGVTVADLLFPWFMWMMGVSMALSFASLEAKGVQSSEIWRKMIKRTLILFAIGMFLANGYELSTWRIPGVLQYFSVSYFVTAATVLAFSALTKRTLESIRIKEKQHHDLHTKWSLNPEDRGLLGGLCYPRPSRVMLGYCYEWPVQIILIVMYIAITYGGKAPGCPRGYIGAGGLADHGEYEDCTGGIHRYVDIMLFTNKLIYQHPTCKNIYHCTSYDPEGFVGCLTACTLTYLGLMTGRVLLQFQSPKARLTRWLSWAVIMLFIAGGLCGFSQFDGFMPINKNLWTTSFALLTAGGGLIGLSTCYVLVDVTKLWSGAPLRYMGMNSILLYVGHDILGTFFPFSYKTQSTSHSKLLQMHTIGVTCWILIAIYLFHKKIFWKI